MEYITQHSVAQPNGCWIWTLAKDKDGYGAIKVDGKAKRAHRIALVAVGRLKEYDTRIACHTCDTPSCVNPDHLYAGTKATNGKDKVSRGRSANGEKHGMARFTEAEITTIRNRYANGERMCNLAREYSSSAPHIWSIVNRRVWRHI